MVIRARVVRECLVGPPGECPVQVELEGADPQELRDLEDQVEAQGISFSVAASVDQVEELVPTVVEKPVEELTDQELATELLDRVEDSQSVDAEPPVCEIPDDPDALITRQEAECIVDAKWAERAIDEALARLEGGQ